MSYIAGRAPIALLTLAACSLGDFVPASPAIDAAPVAPLSCAPTAATLHAPDPRLRGPSLIAVDKRHRQLALYQEGRLAGCWRAAFGTGSPAGPKRVEGDLRTPEGWYRTSDKPTSSYYGAIAIHYPNQADADLGLAEGRIDAETHRLIAEALAADAKPPQATALGGEILIHGGGAGADWTLGCVGLENGDIDELRAALPAGIRTDILILP